MTEFLAALAGGLRAMSAWEFVAVALAVAYLLLAIRQNILCWPAAILSAGIFSGLMFDAGLYMQSALQVFYVGMALYGLWHWSRGAPGHSLPVTVMPAGHHFLTVGLIVLAGVASGWLLAAHSEAAHPYLDALTAWGAIVTTWMVARKYLQNWHYWFVIDVVLVYLYASQGLWLTAALFVFYLVMVVVGYRRWRGSMAFAHE